MTEKTSRVSEFAMSSTLKLEAGDNEARNALYHAVVSMHPDDLRKFLARHESNHRRELKVTSPKRT